MQVLDARSLPRPPRLINSSLHIAAGVAILCFAAGLATLILEGGGGNMIAHVVAGSGVLTGATSILTAVLAATVASSIRQLHDSQGAYLLYRGATTGALASMSLFAVLLAAGAIGMGATRLLSPARARAGLLAAAVLFIGGFDFLAPDGPLHPVMVLGGVLALAVVAVLSAALLGVARSAEQAHRHISPRAAIN